MKPHTQNRC